MYAALAQQKYKQQGVLTANPVELVIMLYDGCIKNLKISKMAIEEKQIEKANNSLQRTQLIILELINSLDLKFSIAQDLMSLYDFLINEIMKINASKDPTNIPALIDILDQLRDAWKTVAKESAGSMLVEEE